MTENIDQCRYIKQIDSIKQILFYEWIKDKRVQNLDIQKLNDFFKVLYQEDINTLIIKQLIQIAIKELQDEKHEIRDSDEFKSGLEKLK